MCSESIILLKARMAKIDFVEVKNGNSLSAINANFNEIALELQNKVLYRDNPIGETNTVKNDLDLDGNDIFNVGVVSATDLLVNGQTIAEIVGDSGAVVIAEAEAARDAAIAAQGASEAAAVASGNSAASASASATAASNSAIAADASADAAAASAQTAQDIADDLGAIVTSVNGRSGDVVLAATDVNLGSVDNTSDANKPVSAAQATAIAVTPGKLIAIRTFTTTQVYTATVGTGRVFIKGVGPGGGGGGATATGAATISVGGGGGAGAYGETFLTAGFDGATITIGAPGTGVVGAAGNAGANSSFGGAIMFQGGLGGAAGVAGAQSSAAGGPGGLSTGGTILNTFGETGFDGLAASVTVAFMAGRGASTAFGSGAPGAVTNTAGAALGGAITGFGGGGGGGATGFSQPALQGSTGGPSVIWVYEYT